MTKTGTTYIREGMHSRDHQITVDSHVIILGKRGFAVEGLEHLRGYESKLPVTIVSTKCPQAQQVLEGQGYKAYRQPTNFVPHYENEF